jgi:predicted transcriptional regulator
MQEGSMSDETADAASPTALLELTTTIVSAYAAKTKLSPSELVGVIGSISRALAGIGAQPNELAKAELIPAVPIKKSVTPDYVICLEDGKKLKMMRRHLMSTYQMTPEQYRTKWNLPKDYPMVAPSYARTRSELAKKIGLGQRTSAASKPVAPSGPKRAARTKAPAKAKQTAASA